MGGLIQTRRRGVEINKDLTIKLSDRSGLGKFTIKDVDGFPIFWVDSQGNFAVKGKQTRTTTG